MSRNAFSVAVLVVLCLAFCPLSSQAQPGVKLVTSVWHIDPACPGSGADDQVAVIMKPVGLGSNPSWTVAMAVQTNETSCPAWINSWSVTGGTSSGTAFAIPLSTEVSKAVRVRATWVGGERDWVITPPAGGDNCFPAPYAPSCKLN